MTKPARNRYCVTLDDDPMIHLVIEKMLDIQTVPFVSAKKLLSRAASFDPIAAFIDIHLGTEESGIQILGELRKIWPFRPLIVVTSDPNPELISQALSLGANDFIRKPLEAIEVKARTQSRVLELQDKISRNTITLGDMSLVKSLNLLKGSCGERHITPSEALLLERLLLSPGTLMLKSELKAQLWGTLKVSSNTIDRKVYLLRQSLSDVSAAVQLVTHYGKGISVEVNHSTDKH